MNRTLEWLNANQNRRYPFYDDSALTVVSGGNLGDDFLLDFQITLESSWLPLTGYPSWAALVSIAVAPDRSILTITFTVNAALFVVVVPASAVTPYCLVGDTSSFSLTAHYAITFGPGVLAFAQNQAIGTHAVQAGTATIDAALIAANQNSRLDSFNGFQGDVTLIPGYNCEPSATGAIIQFSAGSGSGAGVSCRESSTAVLSCSSAWLWFNGVHAGPDGDVQLVGGPGVTITQDPIGSPNTVLISGNTKLANQECG